jgi:S1-C subfamily serine protease
MGLAARSVAATTELPDYVAQAGPQPGQTRARLRAYLGTIPDYTESETRGVKLSGVSRNGPAASAGVQGGDVIVELAGKKIENIYDYTYAIEALKIGQPVDIVVRRGGQRVTLKVVPGSRE